MRLTTIVAAAVATLAAGGPAAASGISEHATGASYAFTLHVGAMEAMYTPAQARAKLSVDKVTVVVLGDQATLGFKAAEPSSPSERNSN
jgi:hypothetical protein